MPAQALAHIISPRFQTQITSKKSFDKLACQTVKREKSPEIIISNLFIIDHTKIIIWAQLQNLGFQNNGFLNVSNFVGVDSALSKKYSTSVLARSEPWKSSTNGSSLRTNQSLANDAPWTSCGARSTLCAKSSTPTYCSCLKCSTAASTSTLSSSCKYWPLSCHAGSSDLAWQCLYCPVTNILASS